MEPKGLDSQVEESQATRIPSRLLGNGAETRGLFSGCGSNTLVPATLSKTDFQSLRRRWHGRPGLTLSAAGRELRLHEVGQTYRLVIQSQAEGR